ncbi:ATP-grasp domain-containing protein [Mycobacterium malmoense]|uniref:ATP-grasp domain-containing protein n=1 Tax=Mycobacterium malmoense TaxID=1780 RepID=UPI0009F6FE02|nr:ATP-grasp domain-containing protein [Mycobacterium malmoense]
MTKTILVSGASGIVGYGTLKSLRMATEIYRLIGTSVYADSVAPAFCDVFELAPYTTDPTYVNWICEIISKHKVDMIIPGIHDDMLKWNKCRKELEATGVKPLLNNPELIDLCADKWLFQQKLHKHSSKYLIESTLDGTFAELESAYGLPFLLKPRRGFGSKGIVIVASEGVFNQHKADIGEVLMAQPIVGNTETEYTISAFFDVDSKLRCLIGLRRKLAKEGFTEKAVVDMPPHAEEAIEELSVLLKPVGPTNFQFRLHDDELKLLEINARISSATSIRSAFGYNESSMAVDYCLNGTLPTQPVIRHGYAVRYMEDHIFYDRDTV